MAPPRIPRRALLVGDAAVQGHRELLPCGLGNLCGPFFRSHGMDMRRYASLSAPGADPEAVRAGRWELPGLSARVETDARWIGATRVEEQIEIRYGVPAGMRGNEMRFVISV